VASHLGDREMSDLYDAYSRSLGYHQGLGGMRDRDLAEIWHDPALILFAQSFVKLAGAILPDIKPPSPEALLSIDTTGIGAQRVRAGSERGVICHRLGPADRGSCTRKAQPVERQARTLLIQSRPVIFELDIMAAQDIARIIAHDRHVPIGALAVGTIAHAPQGGKASQRQHHGGKAHRAVHALPSLSGA
jgi:hypothetical protein